MRLVDDYKAFTKKGGFKKKLATLFFNPCFHCVVLFRIESLLYKIHLGLISKIIWYLNRTLYHTDIDYRADLAGGLCLVHGLGVVIGKNVVSYGPLTVYQGVTIGGSGKTRKYEKKIIDQPVIGENSVIYTGAYIFGPVIIAPNSVIKAGKIITQDVNED